MGTSELNAAMGNLAMEQHPIQGKEETRQVVSYYRNRDKHRPDGPLGTYAGFTYLP